MTGWKSCLLMGSRKMWIWVTVISSKTATTEEEEEFDNNDKEEEVKDGQPQNVDLGDR